MCKYCIIYNFVFYEVFILLSRVKAVSRKYNCTVKERFTLDSGKGTDFRVGPGRAVNIYEGQRWIVYHWLKGKCPAIPRTFSRLLLLSLCHVSVCVCVCLYVCPCAFNSLSRQPDGFLCLWASVVGPLSLSCDAIILSGAAVFSWGKEVISFPAFVWAWMRAALFQQYSLVSTPFSIRTKIYTPVLVQ